MVVVSDCLPVVAGGVPQCHGQSIYLLDRDGAGLLPVSMGKPNPLLAALRRLPLLGRLMPPLHTVRWGAVGTYQVYLRAAPSGACAAPPCYQALLLDAAPGSL
jgi:hypothetical protein